MKNNSMLENEQLILRHRRRRKFISWPAARSPRCLASHDPPLLCSNDFLRVQIRFGSHPLQSSCADDQVRSPWLVNPIGPQNWSVDDQTLILKRARWTVAANVFSCHPPPFCFDLCCDILCSWFQLFVLFLSWQKFLTNPDSDDHHHTN